MSVTDWLTDDDEQNNEKDIKAVLKYERTKNPQNIKERRGGKTRKRYFLPFIFLYRVMISLTPYGCVCDEGLLFLLDLLRKEKEGEKDRMRFFS